MSHESIAKATPQPHEASRVEALLPEQLKGSSDTLIRFLKEYYDYMNQEGNPTEELSHIVTENDINETSSKYLDAIQAEIAAIVPNSDYMDRKTLYKRIVHYYRSKGTIESVYTFFRIFFNDVDDLQIEYGDEPYTYRIRTARLPAGGQEWRSKFKKLAHPAGLRFTVSQLVEAGVVGGDDLGTVKPGWDPDFWLGDDSQNEDYWANHDEGDSDEDWHFDLVPPNRRQSNIDTYPLPTLRFSLESESNINGTSGFIVEEIMNRSPSKNGYIGSGEKPTWDSTEEAWSFDGSNDRIFANTDPRMDGLDPANVGDLFWDYFTDSQGDSLKFWQFDEEDPFTISFWIKTSQTADSIFASSRDANGVALGKIDEKFALLYVQEGGDPDASDGVPVVLSSTTSITDNEWHHLAYVYDGNRSGSLWVDGVKEATDTNINLESFLDDGTSRQHTFHLATIMAGIVPNESQGSEGALFTSGYLKDFRVYQTNVTDGHAYFLYGSGANSTVNPYQALDLDPFDAYWLSKYEPPTEILVRQLVNTQAGLRWRSTGVDRIEISGDDSDFITNIYGGAGTDVVPDIYGDDGESDTDNSELFEAPPAELLESRFVSVSFNLRTFIENARDSATHTRYNKYQDKFFDPAEISSYAKLTFEDMDRDYDFSLTHNQFSVFGTEITSIPHTLKLLYSDSQQGGAYLDDDSAGSEGEIIRIQLTSRDIESVGSHVKFAIELENTDELSSEDWTLYDESEDYFDSDRNLSFLIIRPDRYADHSEQGFVNGNYYAAGVSTTDYLKIYQATGNETARVGVPLTITAEESATAIDSSVQNVWGWGVIGPDGSIVDIEIAFPGAGFTTTHNIGDLGTAELAYENYATLPDHYLIKVGTEFRASSAYVVGDQFFAGDNLYEVTVAGTSAASAPTGTGTGITSNTMTIDYVGEVAKAWVTQFDESTNSTTGKGGIDSYEFITRGGGYRTLAPDHAHGYEPDKSRFRLGAGHANTHAVRYSAVHQYTIGTSAAESAGENYRPWFLDGDHNIENPDEVLIWHYQNTQRTDGNTSTIRLDIIADGVSEPTGTITVRSTDYRSLTDTLIIEDSQ